jgi:HAD superfamily hydrolase (TIGR01490 family)
MEKPKKKVAVFDIDGTIFRSNLHFELFKGLVEYGIFPSIVLKEIEEYHNDWINRRGKYRNFEQSLILSYQNRLKGKVVEDIQKVSRYVVREKMEHVYVYTRDMIEQLRSDYLLVAISGSPWEIVDAFTANWKFDAAYGTIYGSENGIFTSDITFPSYEVKDVTLKNFCTEHGLSLKDSYGFGDTSGDVAFLDLVEHPVAFNPSKELFGIAKEKKWKTVIERKDVIYEL